MSLPMKVMVCQTNAIVGDLKGNLSLIKSKIQEAVAAGYDVMVFPELVTVGYPPRDLLYSHALWDNHDQLVAKLHTFIRQQSRRITVIFGGLHRVELSHGRVAKYNAAYVMDAESIIHVHKRLLPCYDVFNEERYFESGIGEPYLPIPITYGQGTQATTVYADVLICEDMWNYRNRDHNELLPARYIEDPVSQLRGDGPVFILNGSPYWTGKFQQTKDQVESICAGLRRPVVWVNQIGAHDDIVTAGYSMVSIPFPGMLMKVVTRVGKMFAEDMIGVSLSEDIGIRESLLPAGQVGCVYRHGFHELPILFDKKIEDKDLQAWFVWKAMCLHLQDYCRICGFKKVVIGQSGGVDSALVAAVAALTLGPQNVISVTMPSKHSSNGSINDSKKLVENLGILDFREISIRTIHSSVRDLFLSGGKQEFDTKLTDENIQPRCRMMILMAISGEEDALLLTTGNKSEMALGYYTLYGDGAGGLAIISDLYKTMVRKVCIMLNKYADKEIIPENTITKPPSAELAPNQKDTDSLPSYEQLDPTLDMILNGMSLDQVKRLSEIPERVDEISRKIHINEFKRKQAPVGGAKLTQRAFGSGRLIPIAKKVTYV